MSALQTLLAFKAIGLASGLRESDRRVACALLDHFNRKTGQCDPSLETLAALLGIDRRTAIRAIKRLETAGFFRKVRHGGNFHRNFYEPLWKRFHQVETEWGQRRKAHSLRFGTKKESLLQGPPSHDPGDNSATQTCSNNRLNGTSLEPAKESRSPAPAAPVGSKGLGNGYKNGKGRLSRSRLVPRQSSSNEAARVAAQRRWDADLLAHLSKQPNAYAAAIEKIDSTVLEAATDAELGRRGGGLRYLVDVLDLPAPAPGGAA